MYLNLKGLQMYGLKWRALSDNVEFTVVIMTWVTVTGYLCHKRPLICSVCRSHNSALSPFMVYHQIYTMSATKGYRKCLPFWRKCGVRVVQSRILRIIGLQYWSNKNHEDKQYFYSVIYLLWKNNILVCKMR